MSTHVILFYLAIHKPIALPRQSQHHSGGYSPSPVRLATSLRLSHHPTFHLKVISSINVDGSHCQFQNKKNPIHGVAGAPARLSDEAMWSAFHLDESQFRCSCCLYPMCMLCIRASGATVGFSSSMWLPEGRKITLEVNLLTAEISFLCVDEKDPSMDVQGGRLDGDFESEHRTRITLGLALSHLLCLVGR